MMKLETLREALRKELDDIAGDEPSNANRRIADALQRRLRLADALISTDDNGAIK